MSIYNLPEGWRPCAYQVQQFLRWAGHAAVYLVAVDPAGKAVGRYFEGSVKAACKWAVSKNANGANVYFAPNWVKPELKERPTRSDIRRVFYNHTVIDLSQLAGVRKSEAIMSLYDGHPSPAFVIEAGETITAMWRANGDDLKAEEALNLVLAKRFEGDENRTSLSHIIPLPGTMQWHGGLDDLQSGRSPVQTIWLGMHDPEKAECIWRFKERRR
jgi:hypothetical protein